MTECPQCGRMVDELSIGEPGQACSKCLSSCSSPSACSVAIGRQREKAERAIVLHHYAHSVPSGKSHYLLHGDVVVVFSIPANRHIANFLLGANAPPVWELSRLWAPDGHADNALTMAISAAVRTFRRLEPGVAALVSYADPNVGHAGGVYRAASWVYCGQCEEGRYYVDADGQVVARRKFHSGKRGMRKAEIEALGYRETKRPGKHRFARGLTRHARARLREKWGRPQNAGAEARDARAGDNA